MSKANTKAIPKNFNPLRAQLGEAYREFYKTLPFQGYPLDERTGLPIYRRSAHHRVLPRALTSSEEQRFYDSLPGALKQYIDNGKQRAMRELRKVLEDEADEVEAQEGGHDFVKSYSWEEDPEDNDIAGASVYGEEEDTLDNMTPSIMFIGLAPSIYDEPALSALDKDSWEWKQAQRSPYNKSYWQSLEPHRPKDITPVSAFDRFMSAIRYLNRAKREDQKIQEFLKGSSAIYIDKPVTIPGFWLIQGSKNAKGKAKKQR